jgi:EF hand domain-containing protein
MKTVPSKSAIPAVILGAFFALPTLAANSASGTSHGTVSDHSVTSKSDANAGQAMDMMVRADTNKDGAVTKDEVQKLDPGLATHFDQADANHDGRLSLREFEKLLSYQDEATGRVGGTSGYTPRGSTAGGSSYRK